MLKSNLRRGILAAGLVLASALPAYPASMSDYLENKLIDHLFRGSALAYTAPVTQYLALATTTGSDSACGTEVATGSYARVAMTSNTTNWGNTQSSGTGASTGTNGTTATLVTFTFPTPTATWGTVTELCVFDASTAGNLLWRQALTVSKTINTGDVVDFPAASLTFQIDN